MAIARAVSFLPELILLDEPTSALDPEMTGEVLDMITELREEGANLVIVTHEIAFAREVADYAVLLAEGNIVAEGPSRPFFQNPPNIAAGDFLRSTYRYGLGEVRS
ncbi:MAG: AAA family ATPase [Verrucomicrobiia bacterium]